VSKRLNPKRRRELLQRKALTALAVARNPSTQGNIGRVRSVADRGLTKLAVLSGSSKGLERGLLHTEANLATYSNAPRRSPTKAAMHINPSDVVSITTPDKVREPVNAEFPTPKPQRRLSRPNKVVQVSQKPFSKNGY
jgi:hypothetical protein